MLESLCKPCQLDETKTHLPADILANSGILDFESQMSSMMETLLDLNIKHPLLDVTETVSLIAEIMDQAIEVKCATIIKLGGRDPKDMGAAVGVKETEPAVGGSSSSAAGKMDIPRTSIAQKNEQPMQKEAQDIPDVVNPTETRSKQANRKQSSESRQAAIAKSEPLFDFSEMGTAVSETTTGTSAAANSGVAAVCTFFNSKRGCRNGVKCKALHEKIPKEDSKLNASNHGSSTASPVVAKSTAAAAAASSLSSGNSPGVCRFFNSKQGCRNGDRCKLVHEEKGVTAAVEGLHHKESLETGSATRFVPVVTRIRNGSKTLLNLTDDEGAFGSGDFEKSVWPQQQLIQEDKRQEDQPQQQQHPQTQTQTQSQAFQIPDMLPATTHSTGVSSSFHHGSVPFSVDPMVSLFMDPPHQQQQQPRPTGGFGDMMSQTIGTSSGSGSSPFDEPLRMNLASSLLSNPRTHSISSGGSNNIAVAAADAYQQSSTSSFFPDDFGTNATGGIASNGLNLGGSYGTLAAAGAAAPSNSSVLELELEEEEEYRQLFHCIRDYRLFRISSLNEQYLQQQQLPYMPSPCITISTTATSATAATGL
ncbi:hypothetical protein BDR26DRAFT_29393 [Obelidium mucronatum]|nr:hypothetical protein BDR26DRAFT_29393 [Obelidium mucronatum]